MTTTNTLRIEKRTFCGIELDIILGHPEHEMLFFATQTLTVAGLADPKKSVQKAKNLLGARENSMQYKDLRTKVDNWSTLRGLTSVLGSPRWQDTWLFTESLVYKTLLRGHSPNTEPFRKWVTEEVLPTIRKTKARLRLLAPTTSMTL